LPHAGYLLIDRSDGKLFEVQTSSKIIDMASEDFVEVEGVEKLRECLSTLAIKGLYENLGEALSDDEEESEEE